MGFAIDQVRAAGALGMGDMITAKRVPGLSGMLQAPWNHVGASLLAKAECQPLRCD